jgi:hypothetical protein
MIILPRTSFSKLMKRLLSSFILISTMALYSFAAELLPIRGLHVSAPSKSEAPTLIKFVRETLPKERINTLVLECNYTYDFQTRPEFSDSSAFGKTEAQALAQACRESNVQLIPLINCLGHQSWAKQNGRFLQKHPELDETAGKYPGNEGIYCRSYCPLHPELHALLFELMDELAKDCDAKAFHIGMDEVFILADPDCPRCKGKDPALLFAGEVKVLRDHLKQIGCRTWLWGDRFIDGKATGLGKWEASQNGTQGAIDLVPKDIVICDWHYEKATDTPEFFARKGFDVVVCPWRKPDIALAQLDKVRNLRGQNDPPSAHVLGMMQTSWSGFSRFHKGYTAATETNQADSKPADPNAQCFIALRKAMREP